MPQPTRPEPEGTQPGSEFDEVPPAVAGRSLQLNTAVITAAKLFGIVLQLALSPFIVHQIGLGLFGFWAIVSALVSYAALLDLGIGVALSRYVATYAALDEKHRIPTMAAAGMAVSWSVSGAIVLVAVLACGLAPEAWTRSLPDGWHWCIVAVSGGLACVLSSAAFQAFPRGFARFDLDVLPGMAYQATFAISAVTALLMDYGLRGLGAATLLAGMAMLATARTVQRRVWKAPVRVSQAKRTHVGELIRYGANLQASAFLSIVNTQADKPAILLVGGSLEFVGLYELASRVAFQLRALPIGAFGPLSIRLTSETAGKPVSEARAPYEWAFRGVLAIGVGPMFAFYGAGFPLMMAWLGVDFRDAALMMLVLAFGYTVNLGTGAGTALANGYGRPDLERNYSLLSLAVNVTFSIILGLAFGPWGVVFATTLGLIISSLWFQRIVTRWLADGSDWHSHAIRKSTKPLLLGLLLAITFVVLTGPVEQAGRLPLLFLGGLFGFVTVGLFLSLVPESRVLIPSRLRRS